MNLLYLIIFITLLQRILFKHIELRRKQHRHVRVVILHAALHVVYTALNTRKLRPRQPHDVAPEVAAHRDTVTHGMSAKVGGPGAPVNELAIPPRPARWT